MLLKTLTALLHIAIPDLSRVEILKCYFKGNIIKRVNKSRFSCNRSAILCSSEHIKIYSLRIPVGAIKLTKNL